MQRVVLRAKIHRATVTAVTEAELPMHHARVVHVDAENRVSEEVTIS